MKLNRKQELALIELGLKSLIDGLGQRKEVAKKPAGKKWTPQQRANFMKTMKKKWAEKKKNHEDSRYR